MRKTLSFLKPYKIQITIAYLLTFIELAVELSLPILLGKMINEGVMREQLNIVFFWGIVLIILAFISLLSGIVNSFYASHTSNYFAYDIRKALFHRIQSFSFATINSLSASSIMTNFTNDVRQVQTTIFMGLRIMTRAPLMIIGSVIMAFIINIKLAFIFVIIVPVILVLVIFVLRKTANMFKVVQQKVDKVNLIVQENLLNMRLIKAFVKHRFERAKFKQANEDLTVTTKRTFRFVESSMPLLLLIMNLSIVFLLWFGHSQIISSQSTVGDVVAIINYALRIAMAISMLTFITLNFSRMQASAKRLSDILTLDDIDEIKRENNVSEIKCGAIRFENITFSYPNAQNNTLKNITFSVRPNETIAVLGATGSGKTTLFQLIARLYEPNEGTIYIDNKPLKTYSIKRLREQIGYVSQSPLLFSGSIIDNIRWGNRSATEEEIINSTKTAQIHDVITSLPDGYHTEVNQRGVNLSGGQKQRLSIARALVRKPKLLLLDDCTSALDYATETKLLEALTHYHCTTMIITQKVSTALNADRILLLENGKVLDFGTSKQLKANSQLFRDIIHSQTDKELSDVT